MRPTLLHLLVLSLACSACSSERKPAASGGQPVDITPATVPMTQPTTAPAAAAWRIEKPALVTAQEWGSTPQPIPDSRKHTPRFITVHHAGVVWRSTGDPARFVKNMQSWGQRDKNWPDLPYHFLIAPDGRIFEGRPLAYEPESNTKYDLQGHIGVELMGDFNKQRMTQEQLGSLVAVVSWLCDELEIDPSQIGGHKDRAQTSCPGTDGYRYIESGQLQAWVSEALAGKKPNPEVGPPLPNGPTIFVGDPAGDPPPATRPATIATTRPAS